MGVMSEAPDPGDTGLFGKLPRTRPGTRSPRRASGGKPAKAKAAAAPKARPAATAARAPAPPPPARERKGSDPEEQGAGLEELAWAGIAVTAEAATLGVRLMSRALDAARRAAERG
jgi:hypothetical protein